MSFGVQSFDGSGNLLWDSATVVGGVPADVQRIPAGSSTATFSYPQWAGYTAYLVDCIGTTAFSSLDTSSGYPVVTVATAAVDVIFVLMVY